MIEKGHRWPVCMTQWKNLPERVRLLSCYRGGSWSELEPILQPSPPSQWASSLISFLTASLGSVPSLCSPQDFSPQTLSPTGWLRSNRRCHSLRSLSFFHSVAKALHFYLQHSNAIWISILVQFIYMHYHLSFIICCVVLTSM